MAEGTNLNGVNVINQALIPWVRGRQHDKRRSQQRLAMRRYPWGEGTAAGHVVQVNAD